MPVDLWPVMQHRMDRYRADPRWGDGSAATPAARRAGCSRRSRRAARRRHASSTTAAPRDKDNWGWNWSEARKALEYLFLVGDAGDRGPQLGRSSASTTCPSGCCPPQCWRRRRPSRPRPTSSWSAAPRSSHGVGTEQCLRDYFRMEVAEAEAGDPSHWSTTVSCCRSRSRAGSVPPTCTATPTLPRRGARARPAQPVRPGGLGARAHAAAVRLPLPDRDLRARAEAGVRLLRAAVPARRPDRRPGRPQGRPPVRAGCWCRRVRRGARTAETAHELAERAARPRRGSAGRDRRGPRRPGRAGRSSCARRAAPPSSAWERCHGVALDDAGRLTFDGSRTLPRILRSTNFGSPPCRMLDKVLRMGEGKILRQLETISRAGQRDRGRVRRDERRRAPRHDRRVQGAPGRRARRSTTCMPEAFATVREAAKRVLGQRHFDVQIDGRRGAAPRQHRRDEDR